MSIRRILLGLAFVAFVAEATAVTWMTGIGGSIEALLANPVTRFVTAELAICLAMLCVWMWRDARQRGISVLPYVVATLALGGGGPLLYFAMHPERAGAADSEDPRAPVAGAEAARVRA